MKIGISDAAKRLDRELTAYGRERLRPETLASIKELITAEMLSEIHFMLKKLTTGKGAS